MSRNRQLTDEEVVKRVREGVRFAIMKQEAMGIEVVRYDPENSCLYIKNPDGTRKIVKSDVKKVTFSEWSTEKSQES